MFPEAFLKLLHFIQAPRPPGLTNPINAYVTLPWASDAHAGHSPFHSQPSSQGTIFLKDKLHSIATVLTPFSGFPQRTGHSPVRGLGWGLCFISPWWAARSFSKPPPLGLQPASPLGPGCLLRLSLKLTWPLPQLMVPPAGGRAWLVKTKPSFLLSCTQKK